MGGDGRLRVLVTNDDGFASPGLGAIARAVVAAGHDALVVCPDDDYSGSAASLGRVHPDEHIDVRAEPVAGGDGIVAQAVDGPPALCVMAAVLGGFGPPPDLVVSGINPGLNTGRATLHSGTVGAVLTGANFGLSGLAVSIDAGDPQHWSTAADLAVEVLPWLAGQPARTAVNLNVPNTLAEDQVRLRVATLAPFGIVRAALIENDEGRLQMELRGTTDALPEDSDTALVAAGHAAVSTIRGVRADDQDAIRAWVAASSADRKRVS
jgi:5'-nucleotidase